MDFTQEYNIVVERINREISLLFQRLNFFLVGSAFLITGFATLVVYRGHPLSGHTFILSYIINFVGLYLSALFVVANYINTRIIWNLDKYVRDLENKQKRKVNTRKPFTNVRNIAINTVIKDEFHSNYLYLIFRLFKELWNYLLDFAHASEIGMVPHTYVIPLGFTLFWLIVLFTVLPICWPKILILAPVGVLIIVFGFKLAKFKLTKSNTASEQTAQRGESH